MSLSLTSGLSYPRSIIFTMTSCLIGTYLIIDLHITETSTLISVTYYVLFDFLNEETSILRTNFRGPNVSIIYRLYYNCYHDIVFVLFIDT